MTLAEQGFILVVEDDQGEIEYPNVEDFGMSGTCGLMVTYQGGRKDIFDSFERLELRRIDR